MGLLRARVFSRPDRSVVPGLTITGAGESQTSVALSAATSMRAAIRSADASALSFKFQGGGFGYMVESGNTANFAGAPVVASLKVEAYDPLTFKVATGGSVLGDGCNLFVLFYDEAGAACGKLSLSLRQPNAEGRIVTPKGAVRAALALRLSGEGVLKPLVLSVTPTSATAQPAGSRTADRSKRASRASSSGGAGSNRLPAIDLALQQNARRALNAFDKRDLHAFFAMAGQARQQGESTDDGAFLNLLEFLTASHYLTPDRAFELGPALIGAQARTRFLSAEAERSLYTKLIMACSKLSQVDRAVATLNEARAKKLITNSESRTLFAEMMIRKDPAAALDALDVAASLPGSLKGGHALMRVMLTLQLRGWSAAQAVLTAASRNKGLQDSDELLFCAYNIALARDGFSAAQAYLRHYYAIRGLASPLFRDNGVVDVNALVNEPAEASPLPEDAPLVTVIMTAFNAEATVREALSAITAQSWTKLEIIVVDDASTDDTVRIVESLAAEDPRIRILRNHTNIGTYLGRNRAMAQARGTFITFQDSDDWSHPQRIATHVKLMQDNPALVVSRSRWVRVSTDGTIPLRRWSRSFTHANPSSMFIRSSALPTLGFFDAVRADADVEYARRMELLFDAAAFAILPTVFSFGFLRPDSLTQGGAAAVDEENYSPVRTAYKRAWVSTYPDRIRQGALALPALPDAYGYAVPPDLSVNLDGVGDWFAEAAAPAASRQAGAPKRAFVFIVSLASARSSANWARTVEVLGGTLRSMLNQTDPDFRVVICGHERPDLAELDDPRVEFLVTDAAPPAQPKDFRADKMRKRRWILHRLRSLGPIWLMPVDADDRVSSRIVEAVRSRPDSHGFTVVQGYAYDYSRGKLAAVPGVWNLPFERVCGSSAVFRFEPGDLPQIHQEEVGGMCAALLGPHANWLSTAEELGTPLEPLDFPAAVYVLNTDVNLSFARQRGEDRVSVLLRNIDRAEVELTPELRAEFALDATAEDAAAPGDGDGQPADPVIFAAA